MNVLENDLIYSILISVGIYILCYAGTYILWPNDKDKPDREEENPLEVV